MDKVLGELESLIERFTGKILRGRSYRRNKETWRESGNAKATEKFWYSQAAEK